MPGTFVRPTIVVLVGTFTVLLTVTTYRYIRHDLFHPLVLLNGIFTYFIIIPAAAMFILGDLTGPNITRYANPDETLLIAVSILLAAYVAICLGYYAIERGTSTHTRTCGRLLDHTTNDRIVSPYILWWLGLVGFAVGVLAGAYYIAVNGGIVRMLTITPRSAFQTVPNTGRFRWIAQAGLFGGFATVLTALRPKIEPDGQNLSRVETSILIIVLSGVGFGTLVLRGRMLIAVFGAYLLLYLYSADRVSERIVVGAGALIICVGIFFSAIEALLLGGNAFQLLSHGVIHVARFDVFMGIVFHVPTDYPYQWGSTLVGAIPIQWPGQPATYGQQLDLMIGGDRPHLTLSGMLPGELWLNFGPVGLLIVTLVYGAVLGAIYRLRDGDWWLARGFYPLALVTAVFYWPTNILWATKVLTIRMILPVGVAIGGAAVWDRLRSHTDTAVLDD